MTFEEILDQAIAMLRRRGRLTYGAIKLQFDLDDEYLDVLKDELIYCQQLARDEEGKVLVWTGATESIPVDEVESPPIHPRVTPHQNQPLQPDSSREARGAIEAERRQLTVMFCDLVDSTQLSSHLDPEDLREVIRAYQSTSAEVIERYDGYIAQHLGDGLLVYFGWPQAHEDDAQRAVHAGLGILEVIRGLNVRLEQQQGIRLAVRIGIHMGLVVVGEMGQGARQEHLALGETPNVAARIQGMAPPDTVAVSEATYRLIQGYFTCDPLGIHALRGVAVPISIYGVRGASTAESRFEAATTTGLTPLVGREEEIGLLRRRWEQAKAHEGQVVLLCGEPGIGKSRILQTLGEQVAAEPHVRLRYQCSPYYSNSAFYPIIMQLQRAAQMTRSDTPAQKLTKLGFFARMHEKVYSDPR
jgi:class 3 adenylate cyclase